MSDLVAVGNDKGGTLAVFRVADDKFELLSDTEVGIGCSTFALAGDLIYCAVKEPAPAILTLRLDRESGALTEVSRTEVPDVLAYLSLVQRGAKTVVLGASYHGAWGASWIAEDGILGAPISQVSYRNAHAVVPDPSGRDVYFVSLGEDVIGQYRIGEGGELTPLSQERLELDAGSGPRHLVFDTHGSNGYLLTEFGGSAIRLSRAADGLLTRAESVSAVDPSAGLAHSAYGLKPREGGLIWAADLVLAANEGWLLCTERSASTVAAIALDGGKLTDRVTLTKTEEQPRGLTVSQDGTRVIVVGEVSGAATLYRFHEGDLEILDRIATGVGPNWVRFI